ncbi:type II/IV secretion system ATPase subunit [Candidatus Micrarchaeota archaeon]|nr:type II/IV secretion system ATPase subunit [Candidatus Micrarchaeota archaeon]
MKIGNFEVGEYAVKESGGKRHLIFDCRNCVYSSSLTDDKACRFHVISILSQVEADLIVLAEVYERVYNENQTKLLKGISELVPKFELENIWGTKNLGKEGTECEKFFGLRHDLLVKISHELIAYDPILSYVTLLSEIRKEKEKMQSESYAVCSEEFMKTLLYLRQEFEKTELISKAKGILAKLESMPDTKQLYYSFFEVQVKPSFIGSRLMFEKPEELELLDEYTVKKSSVQIFKHPNKIEKLYFLNPPEYTLPPEKYFVLSKTKEIVASYQPGKTSLSTIAKSRKYFERVYESTIFDIAKQNNIALSKEEVKELSEIVARYTVGYGILEIILNDRNLTDIYLDSPIGQKPLYVVHSEYGQCQTNILYTEDEAESMASKLRAMSGRPFDEAHPVLDYDLQELETRTAAIGKPLAPDGIAFAFRLHKMTPWTLPQFIDKKFITPLGSGLLSFFIDTQSTMLVTGSRGSGKTSLLGALVLEILQNARIIVQEDTMELAVPYMKEIGFNIQRLKTRSPIGTAKSETEVSPQDALRTALRLGDSALVLGEVRSVEARVLYEAMRVGAAGNIVMGTIHGDSAYSVWDRVVNDLDVPSTSFKATDIVVVARPIRFSGSLERQRRVVQITEVKKEWIKDPLHEGGLLDLMLFDASKDKLELMEDSLKESTLFDRIHKSSGLSMTSMWDSIKMNANSKAFMVELKNKLDFPGLLEAENTVPATNKLMLMKQDQLEENGSVDYEDVLGKWKFWYKNDFVKRLSLRRKKK